MNKRAKRRLQVGLGVFFGLLAVILILVGLGFKPLQVYELGLDYSMVTGSIDSSTIYEAGIHYLSFTHRFLKFNRTTQTEYFYDVNSLTSDQIVTALNVQVQYQITNVAAADLINYYILFGEAPSLILRPVFSNAIHKAISTYTLGMLRVFNDSYLSGLIKANINAALSHLVTMGIVVSIDSITSNYQNKTSSSEIAYLKRKNSNLATQISGLITSSGDYRYRVSTALTQATTSSAKRNSV